MTMRLMSTTAAAATLALASMTPVHADTDDNVAAQASDAAGEIADTVYAVGENVTDTAQAGVDAVGAEGAYGGAANLSAQLDAALTRDTVIRSSDGEILGTVTRRDMENGRVIIDLDGEMEGADERAIENAAVRADSLTVTEGGVMLGMTAEQFASALRTGPRVGGDSDS